MWICTGNLSTPIIYLSGLNGVEVQLEVLNVSMQSNIPCGDTRHPTLALAVQRLMKWTPRVLKSRFNLQVPYGHLDGLRGVGQPMPFCSFFEYYTLGYYLPVPVCLPPYLKRTCMGTYFSIQYLLVALETS